MPTAMFPNLKSLGVVSADPNDLSDDDYQTQVEQLNSRKAMAMALANQSLLPMKLPAPHARASWLNAIAPIVQGLAARSELNSVDEAARDAAAKRTAAMAEWSDALPRATPEHLGAPPASDTETVGPVLIPRTSHADMTQQLAQWRLKGTRFGPAADKIAQSVAEQVSPKPMVVGGSIYDPSSGDFSMSQEARDELASKQQARQDTIDQRRDAAIERSNTASDRLAAEQQWRKDSDALRRDLAGQTNALRRDLAANAATSGGSFQLAGTDAAGNPILFHPRSGQLVQRDDSGAVKPYRGHVYKASEGKEIAAAGKQAMGIDDMESALKTVKADPAIYGSQAGAASYAPNAFGIANKLSGLSPEQLQTRSQVAAMTAETTHSMYGTAFSKTEATQAKSYLVQPSDDAETVQNKLQGRLALERRHFASLPQSARDAYYARKGGGNQGAGNSNTKRPMTQAERDAAYLSQ